MTAVTLSELKESGIIATAADGKLRLSAPPGRLTADLRERIALHRGDLLAEIQADDLRARLVALAGAECIAPALVHRLGPDDLATLDGWNGEALRAYLLALAARSDMEAGRVPADYVQAVTCGLCGPVWLWEGCPPVVLACPWCHVRTAGLAFPRPSIREKEHET